MTHEAVSVYGFAGAFALGATRAGFDVAACLEGEDGFGLASVTENPRHVGQPDAVATDPSDWPVHDNTGLLLGNPPCAAFSVNNRGGKVNHRGASSPINDCMHDLVGHAAKCKGEDGRKGPEVVVFESVQHAGKMGIGLMRRLRKRLSDETGQDYHLTHVYQNALSLGGAQNRPRYFFVAHRVPFGVESPEIRRVETYADRIGGLAGKDTVARKGSDATKVELRHGLVRSKSPHAQRMEAVAPWWRPGERITDAVARCRDETDGLPDAWDGYDWRVLDKGGAYGGAVRVRGDEPARVVYGKGDILHLHWERDRVLSLAEYARLMGYPDDWSFAGASTLTEALTWQGKQLTTECAEWISHWVRRALNGDPGAWDGETTADDPTERTIDVTNDWRIAFDPRTRERRDSRSSALVREMEERPA